MLYLSYGVQMKISIIALALLIPGRALAQTDADYQFRPILHWQTKHLAGWSILPDVTATPLRTLQVAGWRQGDATNWKEAMFGITADTKGVVKPVINLRAYSKGNGTDLYAELHLLTDRSLASTFVTVSLAGGVRFGAESEFLTSLTSKVKSKAGFGPRVSVKVPKVSVVVATTWFVNIRDKAVVRTYVVYNLVR